MDGIVKKITPEEVIERYADMVYRLALLQVKKQTDADDIFQEVFIRLVSHIHKLQNWEHVKAWLIKVTINCSRKHFSRYSARNVFPMEEVTELSVTESGFALVEGDGPVTAAVKSLPVKYRNIVHLFYYEELSIKEIAAILGKKEATIKTNLHRGKQLLRRKLEEIGYGR